MRESFADKGLKLVYDRIEKVSSRIAEQYGGMKPFDQSPMTPQEKIRQFDETTPEEFASLRQEIGDESLMDLAEEINQLRGGV